MGTEAEYGVEVEALSKVWAFAVELVQVDKMAVVDFDHPAEQTVAEPGAEGPALPVKVGPWELQDVACTGLEVSYEVKLNRLTGQKVVPAGVGKGEA